MSASARREDTALGGLTLGTGAFAYRVVGQKDAVEPGIFVLGLQLSSVQWGVSIAAEAEAPAHLGARTIADADQVAQAILAE